MRITVTFERNASHVKGEAQSRVYGPYDWIQGTYNTLRAGENGEIELATYTHDFWITEDGEEWSDFVIS
jgi:hypothetical protein